MNQVNQTARPTRIAAWDLLKLFAIFLVVYGHCMQHLLEVDTRYNPMFLWITSFHMPLFMTLSGLFARNSFRASFKDYFMKRGRQVLLPCLSWSFSIFAVIVILGGDLQIYTIKSFAINSLWFLKSVFVCGILGFIAFKSQRNRVMWVVLTLLLSQVILIWNVFIMYPCFLFGICIFKYLSWILKYKCLVLVISGLLFMVFSLYVSFSPNFWVRDQGIREALFSGTLSLMDNALFLMKVILKRYFQLFIGLLGSSFFITLFFLLFTGLRNVYLLNLAKLGQYTLGVYVIQSLILETILVRWISFSSDYFWSFDFVIAPLISLLIVYVCLFINKVIVFKEGKLATLLFGVSCS